MYVEKFPRLIEKIIQVIRYATTKASLNIFFQNIKDSYKTAVLVVAHSDQYDRSYQSQ